MAKNPRHFPGISGCKRSHTGRYMSCNDLRRSGQGFQGIHHALGVNLGVNLGGGYVLMPESLLDQPDVSGLIVEPGGKGMAQGMGRDGCFNTCFPAPAADDPLDLARGQAMALSIPEQRVSRKCPSSQGPKGIKDGSVNRDAIRISTFYMEKRDCPSVPGHIINVERDTFTESAAGGQHEGEQGSVPFGPLPREVERQQRLYFICGKDGRWQCLMPAAFQDRSRVPVNQPPGFTPGEQGLQADPVAIDGGLGSLGSTRSNLNVVGGHKPGKQLGSDSIDLGLPGKPAERAEVAPVGSDGMRRSAFVGEVDQELIDRFCGRHGALRSTIDCTRCCVHLSLGRGALSSHISSFSQTTYAGDNIAIGAR